jgi:hypothetical protein
MRCHFKNLSTVCLPAFVGILLLTTASSFGQILPAYVGDPVRRHEELIDDNEKPQDQTSSQQKAPQHRIFAQPGAMVEQLKKLGAEQKSRWEELLRVLKLAVNLLSGNETNLLSGNRPELLSKNKAALLSGNSPHLLSGNRPKLLSGNKPEILSHNKTSLFSGNHISLFSGIKIEIHIENTGNNSGNKSHASPHAESDESMQDTPAVEPQAETSNP